MMVWYIYDENDKRPLPIVKNKKVIGLFKDELGGKIIKEFCALRGKTYAYFMGDDSEVKKAKGTKKMCNKITNIWWDWIIPIRNKCV